MRAARWCRRRPACPGSRPAGGEGDEEAAVSGSESVARHLVRRESTSRSRRRSHAEPTDAGPRRPGTAPHWRRARTSSRSLWGAIAEAPGTRRSSVGRPSRGAAAELREQFRSPRADVTKARDTNYESPRKIPKEAPTLERLGAWEHRSHSRLRSASAPCAPSGSTRASTRHGGRRSRPSRLAGAHHDAHGPRARRAGAGAARP